MIAQSAKDDYNDLLAAGLPATLEDFDRLNSIALRLECGPETTGANFPRVGWAGDVPFFEPTYQALSWYLQYAERMNCDAATKDTLWAFALAHGREKGAFDSLVAPDAIEKAVGKWAKSLTVTREEVQRACRYAVNGYDDAIPGTDPNRSVKFRANRTEAEAALARLHERLTKACISCGATMEELFVQTQSTLDAMYEAYAVEHGKQLSINEARLLRDYKLTLKEIRARLEAEKAKEAGNG